MGIRIITDSASDVTQQEAAKWNVEVLPLTVRFGDEEYLDGITIDYDMFYNRLIETDVVPKTSQVTPFAYEKAFRKALDAGDDIICLTISSKLSGCYQSACIAADEMKERARIMIVDTLEVSMAEYILVQRAVQLRDQGYSADRIAETIEKIRGNVQLIALFDTLEYLKLGGRINAATAIAGSLLSIKPVITVKDGEIVVIGKARGSKNGNNMLMQFVRDHGGIDFEMPYCIAWTGLSDDTTRKYIEDSHDLYEGSPDELPVKRVGPAVGVYAGPGALAFVFFPKG